MVEDHTNGSVQLSVQKEGAATVYFIGTEHGSFDACFAIHEVFLKLFSKRTSTLILLEGFSSKEPVKPTIDNIGCAYMKDRVEVCFAERLASYLGIPVMSPFSDPIIFDPEYHKNEREDLKYEVLFNIYTRVPGTHFEKFEHMLKIAELPVTDITKFKLDMISRKPDLANIAKRALQLAKNISKYALSYDALVVIVGQKHVQPEGRLNWTNNNKRRMNNEDRLSKKNEFRCGAKSECICSKTLLFFGYDGGGRFGGESFGGEGGETACKV